MQPAVQSHPVIFQQSIVLYLWQERLGAARDGPDGAILDDMGMGYRDTRTSSAADGVVPGAAGSSRFDTRIDCILLPPDVDISLASAPTAPAPVPASPHNTQANKVTLSFEKGSYNVIDTSDVTDHNMVVTSNQPSLYAWKGMIISVLPEN